MGLPLDVLSFPQGPKLLSQLVLNLVIALRRRIWNQRDLHRAPLSIVQPMPGSIGIDGWSRPGGKTWTLDQTVPVVALCYPT